MAIDPAEVSRRRFVLGLGAGVTLGGGGAATYEKPKPATPVTIDPNTIRRRGVGFRGYDLRRAYPDYLLERTTDGKTVWEWRAWEHMEPEDYPISSPSDARSEGPMGTG